MICRRIGFFLAGGVAALAAGGGAVAYTTAGTSPPAEMNKRSEAPLQGYI